MGDERGPCKAEGPPPAPHPSPPLAVSRSPVHDDVHVAAVPLEAGAQQDVIPAGEADLHGVVGHHLGVRLQHGLQFQQGLLGLLSALGRGGQNPDLGEGSPEPSHRVLHGPPARAQGWALPVPEAVQAGGSSQSPSHRRGACECASWGATPAPGLALAPAQSGLPSGVWPQLSHTPGLFLF